MLDDVQWVDADLVALVTELLSLLSRFDLVDRREHAPASRTYSLDLAVRAARGAADANDGVAALGQGERHRHHQLVERPLSGRFDHRQCHVHADERHVSLQKDGDGRFVHLSQVLAAARSIGAARRVRPRDHDPHGAEHARAL
ncbi:MAG TPA: hypothetical protein VGH63_10250 [Polyangia bacterium]